MSFIRLVVTGLKLAGRPIYTCCHCGREEQGSSTTLGWTGLETDARELAGIGDAAVRAVGRSHIPVGWESRGSEGVFCPRCHGKRNNRGS